MCPWWILVGYQCQRRTDDLPRTVTAIVSVPTLRDVAARAGVHVATASRALNAETRRLVNAKTAVRVLDAARALGYQPNPIARGLRTNRSMSVGVVIPDLTTPLFPPIVRGIEDGLMTEGYATLLVSTDNNPEREATLVRALRGRQVDGFFFAKAELAQAVETSPDLLGARSALAALK